MISTKKRLLSMLLAITMIVSMFPHVSFAAGNDSNEPPKEGVVTEVKDQKDDQENLGEKADNPEKAAEEGDKKDPQAEPAEKLDEKAPAEKQELPVKEQQRGGEEQQGEQQAPPAEGQQQSGEEQQQQAPPAEQQGESGNRDGETNYTPQQIHDMIKAYADSHYIVGAEFYTPKIELSIVQAPTNSDAVLAGDEPLSYMLKYHYLAPDKWEEGWSNLEFMADWYGRSSTDPEVLLKNELTIKLPAGLLLVEAGGNSNIPHTPEGSNLNEAHTYTITLDPIAAADKSFFETLKIYVGNNGKENSVNTTGYVFDSDAFSFTTTFEIVDRQNEAPSYVVGTYEQTVSVAPETIKTTSPDIWAAKKSELVSELQTIEGTQYAVFTWDVAVGLLNLGVELIEDEDGNKVIAPDVENDENYYSRPGREYVSTISLSDVFKTTLSKDDSTVTSQAVKFVIQKYGTDGSLGEEVPLTANTAVEIWGDNANAKLKMNQLLSIDSDHDNTADTITPSYTKYRVTVAFEVDEDWIAQFPLIEGYHLNSENTVDMNATFEHLDPLHTISTAEGEVILPATPPGKLTIIKMFTDYNGNEFDYDDDPRSPIDFSNNYKAIAYTISAEENFEVYEMLSNGSYQLVEGMTGHNSYTLTSHKDYYLLPGVTYTISEALNENQQTVMHQKTGESSFTYTPVPDGAETFTFHNEETVGKIIIYKKDDSGRNLGGAVFKLYQNGVEVFSGETNDQGQYIFYRVPYGSYVLKEFSAPDGYAPDFPDTPVTLSSAESEKTYNAVNKQTDTVLTLIKKVAVGTAAYGNAPDNFASFELQRKLPGGEWETVEGANNVISGGEGKIVNVLPAFSNDGQVYTYRFKETIPSGYYNPDGEEGPGDVAYSAEVQLVDADNHALSKTIEMHNRRLVKIHAQKAFYTIQDNGTTQLTNQTTTVKLYRSVNGGTPEQVGEEKTFGRSNGSYVYADWEDLRAYDDEGNQYTYLIKETDVAGFNPVAGTLLTKWSVDNSYYAIDLSGGTSPTFTPLLNNYRNIIPVRMWKFNFATKGRWANSGAKFTVYKSNGDIATDAKTGQQLKDLEFGTNPYKDFFLEAGETYTFKETPTTGTTTSNDHTPWHLARYATGKLWPANSPTTANFTLVTTDYGTIDLHDESQPARSNAGTKRWAAGIANQPEPIAKIKKISSEDSTGAHISGAQFTVYTKNADGKYEPYPNATSPMVIDATNANVTGKFFTLGTETSKDFYFRETKVPANYMKPDTSWSYYQNLSGYVQGETVSGETATFYKVTVTNVTTQTDNAFSFTFQNVPNTAQLKVTKYLDGVQARGYTFPITVAPGEIQSDGTQAASTTRDTGADGTVTFNLPIYDANGAQITYTISETLTGDLAAAYIKVSADQTATLTYGQVTTTDGEGHDLKVENQTRIKVWTTKVYRRAYEYGFEGWYSKVPGVTVGLFQHVVDNDANPAVDKWVLVETTTTTDEGTAAFERLVRGVDYALVEMACPYDYMYPYMPGHGNVPGQYRAYPPEGTTEIPNSQINNYNTLFLEGSTTVNPFSGENGTLKTEYPLDDMVNSNHWVQFHITKWKDNPAGQWAPADDPEHPWTPGSEDQKLDNAVFELWRIVMPDGVDTVTFPNTGWTTPNDQEPYTWVSLGSYSSGTMYNHSDERQVGQFMTDSDQNINDHYVYLLVEKNPGPTGVDIIPDYKYTYWHATGTDYTVTVPSFTGSGSNGHTRPNGEIREKYYTIDRINDDDIPNYVFNNGDGGIIYLASVRIAKWRDFYDKESGDFTNDYEPLPGAEFELRLPGPDGTAEGGQVISYLTVGLDSAYNGSGGAAKAQSGVFWLRFNEDGTYSLVDYENSVDGGEVTAYPVEVIHDTHSQEINGNTVVMDIYKIKIFVVETYAPDGFSYETDGYPMWLVFADVIEGDGASWVFNDAYYVLEKDTKNAEGEYTKHYTLAENQEGIAYLVHRTADTDYPIAYGDSQSPLRIVDYPMENAIVDVRKYGYTPTEATAGENSAKLNTYSDEAIARVRMNGVELYLQKKNSSGGWDYWNYKLNKVGTEEEGTFKTDPNGFVRFTEGLTEGVYRIWEKDLKGYANLYEMAYPDSDNARIFTVGKAAVHITLYNPIKTNLKLIKQDMSGTRVTVEGMSFTLGSITVSEPDANGWYIFSNLVSGNYKLTETVPGYSTAYLEEYLSNYNGEDLSALVSDAGMLIGYQYETQGPEGNQEIIVKSISPLVLLNNEGVFELTLKNPKLTNVQLTKVKEGDANTKINGSQFYVFYKPFGDIEGDVSFSVPEAAFTATKASDVVAAFTGDNWTQLKSSGNNTTFTTANGGLITLTNQNPGVFVFYEFNAGGDYGVIKDVDGKNIFYAAAATGGLDVSVSFTPTTATIKQYPSGTRVISTYAISTDDTQVSFTVENRPKVEISGKKEVLLNGLQGNLPSGTQLDWSVSFRLWSSLEDITDPEAKPIGSVTLTKSNPGMTKFKTGSANTKLVIGQTYYLQEIVNSPAGQLSINTVLINNAEVTIPESGIIPITVDSATELEITIKNDWLFGRADFIKYDVNGNPENPDDRLNGAEFEVRYLENGEWIEVPNSTVTPDPVVKGKYIAYLPLVSKEATTYRIYETKAPDNFLLPVDVNGNPTYFITVTLSAENNYVSTGLEMTNSQGDRVTIKKYDNIYGATADSNLAADNSAEFALYRFVDNKWVFQKSLMVGKERAGSGEVSFLTEPGGLYAIAEIYFDENVFNRLDGIYLNDTKLTASSQTTYKYDLNGVLQEESGPKDLYILGESAGAVELHAYNVPYLKPRIEKADIGGYQGTTLSDSVKAWMTYNIYEIPADEQIPATREEVENFIAAHTALFDEDVTTEQSNNNVLKNGTYHIWTSNDPEKRWDPHKTYLLVETGVGANGDGEYSTLRKDDPRVTWYTIIDPVDDPIRKQGEEPYVYSYRLENIYGNAEVSLTKTPVSSADDEDSDIKNGAVDSLLKAKEEGRKLVFTINPNVTGENQMLDGFDVWEKGLSFTPSSIEMTYSFTKIIVGSASHLIDPDLLGISSAVISAKVFFYDSLATDATPLATVEIGDVSSAVTVDVPAAAKTAKYFKITYYSQDVIDHTKNIFDDEYCLGEKFRVQPTTVYVTVDKQANGTFGNGVDPVTMIQNDASAVLSYPKWDNKGTGTEPAGNTATASATVNVNPIVLPELQIIKRVGNPSNGVISFDSTGEATVVYQIEITNQSAVDFVNPVITDILPTAVYYVEGSELPGTGSAGETFTVVDVTTTEGKPSVVTHEGQEISEPETAVTFYLDGTLKGGSTVKISFTVKVKLAATYFTGSEFQNDAYLSSNDPDKYYTRDNPYGYTFKDFNGNLGDKLSVEAEQRGTNAKKREAALDEALGDLATLKYAWIGASATVTVGNMTSVTLSKAVHGDKDSGFHETGLGKTTRSNNHTGKIGTVDWRLAVTNGYTQKDYINKLVIGDVIPKFGDVVNTAWDNHMVKVTSVLNNNVDEDRYQVYYYTGALNNAFTAMSDAIHDTSLLIPANGWHPASEFTVPADPEDPEAPKPYFDLENEDWNALKSVKAFVVVFDENVHLEKNTSLIVTYTTYVVDIPDDDDFSENYAFTNANNEFYITFDYYGMNDASSNPVSVTLMDQLVIVEGDVWIDEDQNGEQTHYRTRADYLAYDIIKELVRSLTFVAQDNRTGEGVHPTFTNDVGEEFVENGGYVWNESIKHFRFEDLSPAKVQFESNLYHPDEEGFMVLNPLALKGTDAYNYYLKATLVDSTDNGALMKIFKLSPLGPEHYMSDQILNAGFYDTDHAKDNNFYDPNSRAVTKTYETAPFFLPYSNLDDQSKDMGYMMFRGLEIKKVAADDSTVPVEGATFAIYGEFDEGQGTKVSGSALLFSKISGVYYLVKDKDGVYVTAKDEIPVTSTTSELVTDENGMITVADLNWWKEYVVDETDPAPGYDEGTLVATADPEAKVGTLIQNNTDGSFTLKIPATTKMEVDDVVTVRNVRSIDVQLNVEKILKTVSQKTYTFKFNYKLASVSPDTTAELNEDLLAKDKINTTPLEITVTGSSSGTASAVGSFDPVTLHGTGTYVFEITELTDDDFPGDFDEILVKTATVIISEDADHNLIVENITYSDQDEIEGVKYEKFTNKYEAEGSWTPEANKKLNGRPIIAGEFTYTVKEGTTTVATGTVKADGTIEFTAIQYPDLSYVGTHTYVIKEDTITAAGVSASVDTVTVTVKIDDVYDSEAGKYILKATEVTYDPTDKTFINTFNATGDWTPTVVKVLEGRKMNPGETFTVYVKANADDPDSAAIMVGTVSADADGNPTAWSFSPEKITYTQADVVNYEPTNFTYYIHEKVPLNEQHQENGVTFDTTVHTVVVTVALHQNDDGTYSDKLDVTEDPNNPQVKFINTYKPSKTTAYPTVEKNVTGDTILQDITFTFTLTATEFVGTGTEEDPYGAFQPEDTAITPTANNEWTKTIKVLAGKTLGTVDFDEITYKRTGTYVYTISEVASISAGPGFTGSFEFDVATWTYTVVVEDDLTGNLVATESYTKTVTTEDGTSTVSANKAIFENKYIPKPYEWPLEVEKVLAGEPLYDAAHTTFLFTMTPMQDGVVGYVLPTDLTVTISGTDAQAGPPASVAHFGNIKYELPGTYIFKIEETANPDPELGTHNVHYDTTKWEVTVIVENVPGYGLKVVSTDYADMTHQQNGYSHAIFTNTYTPDEISYTPEVHKELTQRFGPTVEDKTFNFILKPVSTNPPGARLLEDGSATNLTAELVVLKGTTGATKLFDGAIWFKSAGTYQFTVQEVVPNTDPSVQEPGINFYDPTVWTLTVVVEDVKGELKVKSHVYSAASPADGVEYSEGENPNSDNAKIKNSYTPEPTTYQPKVTKKVPTEFGPTVAEKKFQFKLTAVSQEDAKGNAMTGGLFKASAEDDHTGSEFPAGGLEVTVTVPAGTNQNPPELDAFTEVFDWLLFKKAGTYTFTIEETTGSLGGITYDKATWTLTVVIKDTDGELAVASYSYVRVPDATGEDTAAGLTVTQQSSTAEFDQTTGKLKTPVEPTTVGAEFFDPYIPTPTHYQPKVTKKVPTNFGPTVKAKDFVFTLTPVDYPTGGLFQTEDERDLVGNAINAPLEVTVTVPVGTNQTPDVLDAFTEAFNWLIFKKAGTYTFTIKETPGSLPGIDPYDDAEWTLTVVVKDIDGKLVVASWKYEKDGQVVEHSEAEFTETDPPTVVKEVEETIFGAEFSNPYIPAPTKYAPRATKSIEGEPTVVEKTFTFILSDKDKDDNNLNPDLLGFYEMPTETEITITIPAGMHSNAKYADFGEIEFKKAGTYKFIVYEVEESLAGITYDKTVYTLTIEIKDIDGKLMVQSYEYKDDQGNIIDSSKATFSGDDGLTVDSEVVIPTPIGAKFVNPYDVVPTTFEVPVDKLLKTEFGPTVRDKFFDFTLKLQVALNSVIGEEDPIHVEAGYSIAEHTVNEGTAYEMQNVDGEKTQVVVPAGKTNGSEKFGLITFSKAGTYVFEVLEVVPQSDDDKEEGITYSTVKWQITVEVVDHDNKLSVDKVTYDYKYVDTDENGMIVSEDGKPIPVEFTNTYIPNPTYYTPKVTKKITIDFGPIVKDKIFTFTMKPESQVDVAGNPIENGFTVDKHEINGVEFDGFETQVTVKAGEVTADEVFGKITFLKAGDYTFLITEDAGDEEGIDPYDKTTWKLIISVRDMDNDLVVESYQYFRIEEDGTETPVEESKADIDWTNFVLNEEVKETEIGAEFINPYTPNPTDYTPMVTKKIKVDFGPIVADKIFHFTIEELLPEKDAAGKDMKDGAVMPDETKIELIVKAGEITNTAKFGTIKFLKAGTYRFNILETAEDEEGIEYDVAKWELIIVIRDTDNDLVVESYTYKRHTPDGSGSGSTTPGTDTLEPAPGTDTGREDARVDGTAAERIDDSEREDGEIGVAPGTDEPADPYAIVEEHSEAEFDADGKLKTPVKDTVIGATFINPYTPNPTKYIPKVTKVVSGEPIVKDKTFTFTLDADKDNPDGCSLTIADKQLSVTITVPAGTYAKPVSAYFETALEFTMAGTFKFHIREVIPEEDAKEIGIDPYDAAEWILTLVIKDTDNDLVVESYTYEKDGVIVEESKAKFEDPDDPLHMTEPVAEVEIGASFDNPYNVLPTKYTPKVTKHLTVDFGPTVEDKKFYFTLTRISAVNVVDGQEIDCSTATSIAAPGNEITLIVPKGEITATEAFGEITFTKAGTYTYEITELAPLPGDDKAEEGVTYTVAKWLLVIEVVDTDNQLVIASYDYSEIPVDSGKAAALSAASGDEDPDPTTTGTDDGEQPAAAQDVKHSEAEFDENGKLVKEVAETVLGAEFTNIYKPEPTTFQAAVQKTIIGEPTVKEKKFNFTMKLLGAVDAAGDKIDKIEDAIDFTEETVSIIVPAGATGAGIIEKFKEMTISMAGTYTFSITEELEALPGITYDGTEWTLTVKVKDTDGKLEVESAEYAATGKEPSAEYASFENPYQPKPTVNHPVVTKTLSGQPAPEDTVFEFVLKATEVVDGGSHLKGSDKDIVKNDSWTKTIIGPGTVSFDEIEYCKAGTYVYTVVETDKHATGWTYSGLIWTIVVTVVDNDGFLTCTMDYKSNGVVSTTAVFINDYKPIPVTWEPQVQKVLAEDSELPVEDKKFHFEMTQIKAEPADGLDMKADAVFKAETLLKKGEKESEAVSFDKITFTKAGTYTFQVVEIDEGLKGYTYDTTPKTLVVKIVDKSGYLTIESVTIDGEDAKIEESKVVVKVANCFVEEKTDIECEKVWIDGNDHLKLRPVSITIRLYADGVEIDAVTVTAADDWKHEWKDLPKYKNEVEIVYTVTEDSVKNYTTSIEGFLISNKVEVIDTGEDNGLYLWGGTFLISLFALGSVIVMRRKREEKD